MSPPPLRTTGVENAQFGVHVPSVAAEAPPPHDATAPSIRWVTMEFLRRGSTGEAGDRWPRVKVTALARRRPSRGKRITLRRGEFRIFCKFWIRALDTRGSATYIGRQVVD